LQQHSVHEDGSRVRPDAVIFLPQQRQLVVDAKVSLTAYVELANAQNDAERKTANKRLAASLRAHMKSLAEKRYHALPNSNTPDFTIMFVPLEAAFISAIGEDTSLLTDAWALNVLPAGPSTLMFAVRTVSHMWRQDARLKNVDKIAERGAQLYDKLAEFLADLHKVGERLDQARDAYASAKDRLTTRKGNVMRQAEMLKQYGVQPTKTIGETWKASEQAADMPEKEMVLM
jgi:DNA recombination protein RmuC